MTVGLERLDSLDRNFERAKSRTFKPKETSEVKARVTIKAGKRNKSIVSRAKKRGTAMQIKSRRQNDHPQRVLDHMPNW